MPTIHHRSRGSMVGTLRFAHPTGYDLLPWRRPLRVQANFRNGFNVICPVQSSAQKYIAFPHTQISGNFRASRPGKRGV
ncbi:hypothetical protein, partial [Bradyrhizobium lablabi]|uniref:hypothetical protein n=1 Tax=Bradyrhizobium lablabi TaxID=722472 RepID=UPI001AECD247